MYSKFLRQGFSFILRMALCISFLSLLFLTYSGYYGLPLILIQSKLDSFQSEYGKRVEVERVLIRPEGWIIRNVIFHSTNPDQLAPLFSIDSIHVHSFMKLAYCSVCLLFGWAPRAQDYLKGFPSSLMRSCDCMLRAGNHSFSPGLEV